jgi:hypothetical protein
VHSADPALGKERRKPVHGCVRVDGNHLGRHHISCARHRSSSLIRTTYKLLFPHRRAPFQQALSCEGLRSRRRLPSRRFEPVGAKRERRCRIFLPFDDALRPFGSPSWS